MNQGEQGSRPKRLQERELAACLPGWLSCLVCLSLSAAGCYNKTSRGYLLISLPGRSSNLKKMNKQIFISSQMAPVHLVLNLFVLFGMNFIRK